MALICPATEVEGSTWQASVDVLPSVLGGIGSPSEPRTDALLQVGPGECTVSEVVDQLDEFKASIPAVVMAPSMHGGVEGPAGPGVDVHVNRGEPTGPVV